MKKIFLPILLVLIYSCNSNTTITCAIETAEGTITVELYPDNAPITVANFMQYVDARLYDNTSFFRVCTPQNEADREIKIEVIQGSDVAESISFPPIIMETTELTGIKHLDGTISMARLEPNSATSSFFICIGNQPELDFGGKRNPDGQGFAAFGNVTKGMDVVLIIQAQENEEQLLVQPIKIISIKRIK